MQISWSHTYAKVHHRKTKILTAVESVDTALLVAKQLGKNHIGPKLNAVLFANCEELTHFVFIICQTNLVPAKHWKVNH